MSRFRKRKGGSTGPAEEVQAVQELLDPYHHRASVAEGNRMIVQPGKVLDNIAAAMERVDLDINTGVSLDEDVASLEEILSLIQSMLMGPTLAVHVVNTAMRIMTPRYPADLVRRPLPPEYDVRKILPGTTFDELEHETAKRIFNRRLTADTDLSEDDIAADLQPLDASGQLQVFVALFFMYGNKVGAIKHRTGTS